MDCGASHRPLYCAYNFVHRPLSGSNERKTNICYSVACTFHVALIFTVKILSQFWLNFNTCFVVVDGLEMNFVKAKVCVRARVCHRAFCNCKNLQTLIITIPVKWVDKLWRATAEKYIVMLDNFNISNSVFIASVASLFAQLMLCFVCGCGVELSWVVLPNNNNNLKLLDCDTSKWEILSDCDCDCDADDDDDENVGRIRFHLLCDLSATRCALTQYAECHFKSKSWVNKSPLFRPIQW